MALAIGDLATWHLAEVCVLLMHWAIIMHTSLAQAMHKFACQRRICTYVYSADACRREQWNIRMCSVCYTLLLEKDSTASNEGCFKFIIQGDVVFIEEHLLHKTSCHAWDLMYCVQHKNNITILGMSITMVGTLILPDITDILRDPCSSCAIRSASSIKSIPKPCNQDSILIPQFTVRDVQIRFTCQLIRRWHCTMYSKGSLGAGTWWGLVHSQGQHCHTCYFLSSHNLTMFLHYSLLLSPPLF